MTADQVLGIIREAETERGLRVERAGRSGPDGFVFRTIGRAYQNDVLTLTRRSPNVDEWSAIMWRRPPSRRDMRDVLAMDVCSYLDEVAPRAPSVDLVIEKLRAKKHGAKKLAKVLAVLEEP